MPPLAASGYGSNWGFACDPAAGGATDCMLPQNDDESRSGTNARELADLKIGDAVCLAVPFIPLAPSATVLQAFPQSATGPPGFDSSCINPQHSPLCQRDS